MRKRESDSKGPGEFIFFALELLPDELFVISIVIGVVFGLIWLLGAVFRSFFRRITAPGTKQNSLRPRSRVSKGFPRYARDKKS